MSNTDHTPLQHPAPALPIPQLESLKFKANQIIDSIVALQRTIEAGNVAAMPAWPDILSKYNILLSQTHSFSVALVGAGGGRHGAGNVYERIALHPSVGMTDGQLDGEVIPLLRNQQTTDVLRMENETVRRLAEHMATRGAVGVLGGVAGGRGTGGKVEYEEVLKECEEIRGAHDRRTARALRAVTMLRERFDWKQRVEVEVEEPEELTWDPRLAHDAQAGAGRAGQDADPAGDVGMDSSSDEDEVEGALVTLDTQSPTAVTRLPQLAGLLPASVTVTSDL